VQAGSDRRVNVNKNQWAEEILLLAFAKRTGLAASFCMFMLKTDRMMDG
jgi:hypothetical protein